MFSPLIDKLINALRCLPGVGPKSAQRMAFSLLEKKRDNGLLLANVLQQALTTIGRCETCRTFSETPKCGICTNNKRQLDLLCVVETPADVLAIEQISSYRGLYFVLMGHLSPLDGIGPQELGIDQLHQRLRQTPTAIREVILATNPTVEGEATAHYIANVLRCYPIKCTRIAHGVPLGGEIEYTDAGTLARALLARTDVTWEAEST